MTRVRTLFKDWSDVETVRLVRSLAYLILRSLGEKFGKELRPDSIHWHCKPTADKKILFNQI